MLQPLDIALRPILDVAGTVIAIQIYLLGEMLELNLVTVPAAVEAKKQDNRATHDGGKQDRASRECRGRT
jgi:hypothetical protein